MLRFGVTHVLLKIWLLACGLLNKGRVEQGDGILQAGVLQNHHMQQLNKYTVHACCLDAAKYTPKDVVGRL